MNIHIDLAVVDYSHFPGGQFKAIHKVAFVVRKTISLRFYGHTEAALYNPLLLAQYMLMAAFCEEYRRHGKEG